MCSELDTGQGEERLPAWDRLGSNEKRAGGCGVWACWGVEYTTAYGLVTLRSSFAATEEGEMLRIRSMYYRLD